MLGSETVRLGVDRLDGHPLFNLGVVGATSRAAGNAVGEVYGLCLAPNSGYKRTDSKCKRNQLHVGVESGSRRERTDSQSGSLLRIFSWNELTDFIETHRCRMASQLFIYIPLHVATVPL